MLLIQYSSNEITDENIVGLLIYLRSVQNTWISKSNALKDDDLAGIN